MTPLNKILKRTLIIKGAEYVLTLSPDALKLTRKGKRLGLELQWADVTSGESALAVALRASVGKFDAGENGVTPAPKASLKVEKPASIRKGRSAARGAAKKRRR